MGTKVQERKQVVALRKQGKSYREIQAIVPVSKGTISRWCAAAPLTTKQEKYLKERTQVLQDNGRLKVAKQNHRKHADRHERVRTRARIDFQRYKDDPFFTLGVSLYWAHGASTGNYFNFVSSDQAMVRLMIKWAEQFLPVEPVDYQFRLYARTSAKTIDLERSWSRACAIPRSQLKPTVYQSRSTALKDTADYKGSLRFIVPGVDQLLLLQTWQTELSLYHSGTS